MNQHSILAAVTYPVTAYRNEVTPRLLSVRPEKKDHFFFFVKESIMILVNGDFSFQNLLLFSPETS